MSMVIRQNKRNGREMVSRGTPEPKHPSPQGPCRVWVRTPPPRNGKYHFSNFLKKWRFPLGKFPIISPQLPSTSCYKVKIVPHRAPNFALTNVKLPSHPKYQVPLTGRVLWKEMSFSYQTLKLCVLLWEAWDWMFWEQKKKLIIVCFMLRLRWEKIELICS